MKRALIPLCLALMATGCALGPDYKAPTPPLPVAWQESSATGKIEQEWWKNFGDEDLDTLVATALAQNLDIKIALARVREARAERSGVIAGQLPEIGLDAGASREKPSSNANNSTGKSFNTFTAGFDASWEADIFGGRRAIEAANAALQSTEELAHGVTVSLLGDVAAGYIAVRNFESQIAVAENNLHAARDTLALATSRYNAGLVGNVDVVQAEALVRSTQADIPALHSSLRQSLHSLEILLGGQPGSLEYLADKTRPVPVVSGDIVAAAPADVVRNRPDIREAERDLAAATAAHGVALSEVFPKISLAALFGLGTARISTILSAASRTWSLGAGATLPLLDFGRVQSDINAADARQEEAFLTYQKTVLTALKEVENALAACDGEKKRLIALNATVRSQDLAVHLLDERYRKGLTSFLDVLDARRSLYATQLADAQSRTNLSTDMVVLYKALGGGWEGDIKH